MKTNGRSFCLHLLAATALFGCAVDTSPDARGRENVGASSAADTAGYLQTFDPDFQSIIFQPSSAVDSVILHVTIDGARTTNVAMPEASTSAAAGPSYEIGSLPVVAGDTVAYSFTYEANGVGQDTPQFTFTLPASFVPTTFFTQATEHAITVVSTAALAWADVHYTVNGGTPQNVRLAQQGSTYVQPVTLSPGDALDYSVTYATATAVFDTAVVHYAAGANLLAGPWQFVSSDVTPSTAYSINGDSITLDFQGYFSWNGTWASGYTGYTFEQPVAVVEGGPMCSPSTSPTRTSRCRRSWRRRSAARGRCRSSSRSGTGC